MEKTPPQPSPEMIFQHLTSYQRSAALKGAIELEVFTAIADGANTTKALAERCRASERGVRILTDYLTIMGLLTKQNGNYGLTPDSDMFLNRHSPAYLGTVTQFILSEPIVSSFEDVAGAVRKGGTVVPNEGNIAPDNPIWVDFARSMAPMMMPSAQAIAEITHAASGQKWKVLDIAAGHGLFGVALAQKNPNAEIVALDWPGVLAVAEENARAAGVIERFKKLPGDAMKVSFGSGYDIVLLTNFLHHFDVPTCETLLRKVRAALKPDGRAVTFEFVPNGDRVTPPVPAAFSLTMLVGTPSGDAYTFAELERMFKNAGFAKSELHALEVSPESVIVSYA